ncbi:MAG: hypothetical protein Q4F95_00155 [Oscillospiraceae bacterium]|nr:hypothetical protein [Oscillospiraceae bacterium]
MNKRAVNLIMSIICYFVIVLIIFSIARLFKIIVTTNLFGCAFAATLGWIIFRIWRDSVECRRR